MTLDVYCGEPEGEHCASDLFGGREKVRTNVIEKITESLRKKTLEQLNLLEEALCLRSYEIVDKIRAPETMTSSLIEQLADKQGISLMPEGKPNFRTPEEKDYWMHQMKTATPMTMPDQRTDGVDLDLYTKIRTREEVFCEK